MTNFGEFKVPSIFNQVDLNVKQESQTGNPEIDLTSALLQKTSIAKTSSKRQNKRKDENLYIESKNILDGLLLLPEGFGLKKTSIRVAERPSKVAFVLCREWDRKKRICLTDRTESTTNSNDERKTETTSKSKEERKTKSMSKDVKLTPFAFDTPSPDDVVKAAQSNVFQRIQK